MNTQDKIYVMTDFVPERNKNILTVCKVYTANKYGVNDDDLYTIIGDNNETLTIAMEACAYLDGRSWCTIKAESYTYVGKEVSNMTKEQAWKILAFIKKPFGKLSEEQVYLNGGYTKEELEAILLVWDELK